MYKILKPPKFGNCQNADLLQDQRPKISFQDFRKFFANNECKSYRQKHIENLQRRLDAYIESDTWECDDIIEVEEEMSEDVLDCVIYYIYGYICRKMLKNNKCLHCRKAFSTCDENEIFPISELVNLKTKGRLIHPNRHLYKMFKDIV